MIAASRGTAKVYSPPENLSAEDAALEANLVATMREIVKLLRDELSKVITESDLRLWRYHTTALLNEARISRDLLKGPDEPL